MEKDSDIQNAEESVNVPVDFSEGAFLALQRLSKQTGHPMGEVLRQAIELKQWWAQMRNEGARVFIDQNGRISEVIKVG